MKQCLCLIFQVFHCLSPYSISYSVCFSFSMIFRFLVILQVLHCAFHNPGFLSFSRHIPQKQSLCLIFHVFQVSRHIPGPTVCISYFSRFSVFLTIFLVIQYLCLICHLLKFSGHNPDPILRISHLSGFSLFLAIF